MAYDLIIKNGKVIDGFGLPGFHGDMASKTSQWLFIVRSFAGSEYLPFRPSFAVAVKARVFGWQC